MAEPWVTLAAQINFARFGQASTRPPKDMAELLSQIDGERFLDDLQACGGTATGRALLSPTGVRNLLHPKKHPKELGGKSLGFIHYYLNWVRESKSMAASQEPRWKNVLDRIQEAMGTVSARRTGPIQGSVRSLTRSKFFEYVFDKVVESNEERDIFFSHVFKVNDGTAAASYANTAYYVGFRYSTIEGRLVKSFLAILTPAENKQGFFSFVHVVKGDFEYNKLKKVTKGIVINLSPGTYFLGRTLRDNAVTVSNFEMLAIERDTFLAQRPIVHALLMSSAAVNQPILSRMVLFKIGDRVSLGRKLNDDDLNAIEFDQVHLLREIKALLRKCAELGALVQLKSTNSQTLNDHAAALERLVREGINNIPRPALLRTMRDNVRSRKDRPAALADGAIEVWGKEPRP